MRDRGRIKAPSSDPIENLRTRLSEQDRQIQDLYRRLTSPVAAAQTSAAASGESFMVKFDETISGGAGRSTVTEIYSTSAIAINEGSGAGEIDGLEGLWVLHYNVSLYTTDEPTTGSCRMRMNSSADFINLFWTPEILSVDQPTVLSCVEQNNYASWSNIWPEYYVDLGDGVNDAFVTVEGWISGHQLSSSPTVA